MRIPFLPGDDFEGTKLDAPRIYLRPPRRGDWQSWSALRQVSRAFLTPWEPTWAQGALSREAFRRRLRQYREEWEAQIGYSFFLFLRQNHGLLGGISLTNVRRGVALTGTLGYWMGEPHTRQGFMSEALQAVMGFAFEQHGLHRLEAACLPHNDASRRLLGKSGFREVGRVRQYLKIAGTWQDHILYEILRDDTRRKTV